MRRNLWYTPIMMRNKICLKSPVVLLKMRGKPCVSWQGARLLWRLGRVGLLALSVGLLFALGACGGGADNAPNTVSMDQAEFHLSALTVRAGETVHFVNPANGDPHALCIGKENQCAPQSGAPEQLNTTTPVATNPGDTLDIVFPTAGTYIVICTLHPGMQVTITVQ